MFFSKCSSFILLVIFGIDSLSGQLVGNCGPDKSRLFDGCCTRPMIIGNGNVTFPSNIQEANDYCDYSKESVSCMRDFAKECLDALPRQGTSLIAYGIYKNIRNVCKTTEVRTSKI